MRPANLLILMADEHARGALGCYGGPIARTPHLDALAAGGARFTNAYTNCPICAPARAAFATGRYAHQTGYWDNAIAWDGRVPGWGHRLQQAGRRVESIGKLHYRAATDPLGFDAMHIPMYIKDGVGSLTGAIRDPLPPPDPRPPSARPPGMVAKAGPGCSTYNLYDRRIADLACDWLNAAAGAAAGAAPWTLFVSFLAPHYPLTVPAEFFELYAPGDMPAPRLDPADGHARHPWVDTVAHQQTHANGATPALTARALAAYYGLCSYVDHQIGRVTGTLDAAGLAGSTRVIYVSDHGENAGARGLWGKSVLYEESAGIPVIVSGPDVAPGAVCETPVSLVDLFPTVLAAAGVAPAPEDADLPGRSLFDIAAAPADPDRPVFAEYHAMYSPSGGFMLRQGRFKYHYYVGFAPELFDLDADPGETRNLADDPRHAGRRAGFERNLRAIVDPEAADRRAKDDQNALIESFGGRTRVLRDKLGASGFTRVPDEIARDL